MRRQTPISPTIEQRCRAETGNSHVVAAIKIANTIHQPVQNRAVEQTGAIADEGWNVTNIVALRPML